MPTILGDTTRTLFLKSESHKLHEAFTVKELSATLTASADLSASNSTVVTINGNATTATVYATDHDTTMAAIAVKVAALPGVASASASARIITYQMTDQTTAPTGSAVTSAGSAVTWTAATDVNSIKKGMPVKLTTDGELEPAADGENPINIIGYSLHNGYGGEVVTVAMKAYTIVYAEAYAASHNAGPVVYKSTSATTDRQIYDDASVTYANIAGWSLDAQASANGTIRVALFS